MNTILVTGGCGFIGSNFVHHLLQHTDYQVVNIDKLTYAGNQASLAGTENITTYNFEKVDICDAGEIHRIFQRYQPRAVIHLAAESHVDRSIDDPGQFIQTNLVGTYTLLQASLHYWKRLRKDRRCSDADVFRFIHVSTDEVFGSLAESDPPFDESTPYAPHSPYSASKAGSDHLARAWADTYGLPVIVTNCSNNYGPRQFPEKLVPVVILKCLQGKPVPVYGKGENIRDWLFVEDHCRALYNVLEKGSPGETYPIGGNNEQRNIDLVRILCQLVAEEAPRTGHDLPVEDCTRLITYVDDRPGHDQRYAVNTRKIEQELGWSPRESFESGFRKTVRWYLQNPQWWMPLLKGDYNMERLGNTPRGNQVHP